MEINAPTSYEDMDVGGYTLLDPSHSSQGNGSPILGMVALLRVEVGTRAVPEMAKVKMMMRMGKM